MKKILVIEETLSDNFSYEYITEILAKCSDLQVHILTAPKGDLYANRAKTLQALGCTVTYFYDAYLRQVKGHLGSALRGVKRLWNHCHTSGYDIVHINGVSPFSFVAALFADKDARVVVSYWGSDLLRASKAGLVLMQPLLKRADIITVGSSYLKKRLCQLFPKQFCSKISIALFGTNVANHVHQFAVHHTREECKALFSLPIGKLCIFIGYSGSPAHQHVEIAHTLESLPESIRQKIALVFHCSYGLEDNYRSELKALVADSGIECFLITDFLSGDKLAALRMCADIMLNLQVTDSLSASMLESMEAGAIVIKGDWLVYPELEARAPFLLSIPSIKALPGLITNIVENTEHYRKQTERNRGIVLMQSWDSVRGGWLNALGIGDERR